MKIIMLVVGKKIAFAILNSCYFLPNISPVNKFHPNWLKSIKVEKSHYSIAVAFSNSFYVILCPTLAPITNLTQMGLKHFKILEMQKKFQKFKKENILILERFA